MRNGFLLLAFMVASAPWIRAQAIDNYPAYTPSSSWQTQVQQAVADYKAAGYTYAPYMQCPKGNPANPTADYMCWGSALRGWFWRPSAILTFDSQGLPMVLAQDGLYYYNPVTLEQFALTMFGQYVEFGDATLTLFQAALDKLLELQGADGSLRIPYINAYYLNKQYYGPNWVSAIAQGQFLSVMVRAFWLTGNSAYLNAGNKALTFLLTPVAKGGPMDTLAAMDPSLSGREWFDEYPPINGFPSGYTLNDEMFTLVGL